MSVSSSPTVSSKTKKVMGMNKKVGRLGKGLRASYWSMCFHLTFWNFGVCKNESFFPVTFLFNRQSRMPIL